jgi:U4/U6.U5 tri-snRNP-associated protein 2
LSKFDGKNFIEEASGVKKRYKIYKLPKYLIIHVKRFYKNEFFLEKNPTIVNFPIRNLDLTDLIDQSDFEPDTREVYKYDLLANIIHEGKPEGGTYRVQVRHKPTEEWFDIQDLHVNSIMPQQVTVTESYILVFERQ